VDELPPPKGLAVDAGLQLELADAAPEDKEEPAFAIPTPSATTLDRRAGRTMAVPDLGGGTELAQASSVQAALGSYMGGAPLCDVCGHITVRNGSCYKCLNCGNSMGCS
jgi:ribonucleoside-diphosphate reductase alpha chain